jgi:hypothetical protein
LKRTVSKNHITTAAWVNCSRIEYSILKTLFPQKLSNIHGRAAIAKPLITESDAQIHKQWCYNHKTWTSDNWKCVIWSDESFFMPLCLENNQGSLQSGMPGSNSETWGRFYDGLGSNIMIQYSVSPIITLHGQITAREYVDRLDNQVHLVIQTFPNNAVFQGDNAPTHTAGSVQSWFEEHEGEIHHLPRPAQSPDLYITEPVWSVLETKSEEQIPTSNISERNLTMFFKKNSIKFR